MACNTDCNNVSCVNACTKSLENWTHRARQIVYNRERDGDWILLLVSNFGMDSIFVNASRSYMLDVDFIHFGRSEFKM